jgi:hypothetical protein
MDFSRTERLPPWRPQRSTPCFWKLPSDRKAKHLLKDLTNCWLDLANVFGFLKYIFLEELLNSLPTPIELQSTLANIYRNNISQFVVNDDLVPIKSTSGVRQGDGLSFIICHLAAEPLLRCTNNIGFPMLGTTAKATSYADDILVIWQRPAQLQTTIEEMCSVASTLGLQFNGAKYTAITFTKVKVDTSAPLRIDGKPIRTLREGNNETYLGVPIGLIGSSFSVLFHLYPTALLKLLTQTSRHQKSSKFSAATFFPQSHITLQPDE